MRGSRARLRWSYRARTNSLLLLAAHRPWGPQLRWFHAASLAITAEVRSEGITLLESLVREPQIGALAIGELARYETQPKPVEKRHCDGI